MSTKLADEIREPIIKFIEQGLPNEEIARKLRINPLTVKGVRQRLENPVWLKSDRAEIPEAPETPKEEIPEVAPSQKSKALLTIAEIIMRSAAILDFDIDSLYVDKTGKAIVAGTNGGRCITLESNVLAI
ncbi:MAG TPA: hypothetical protein PKL77_08625 [Candidatus Omnitrophota bacterium]|nr:hypothetical protein [Candidatus Omnitrophota bacterium]